MIAEQEWLLLSEEEKLFARRLVAASGFEPYPLFFEDATLALDALITKGIAEAGPSLRPSVAAIGYRLTERGWTLVTANWRSSMPVHAAFRSIQPSERSRPNGSKTSPKRRTSLPDKGQSPAPAILVRTVVQQS